MPPRIRRTVTRSRPSNKLDSLVYNTEKILKENRDKISESEASSLDSALANAKRALENSSAEPGELNCGL